MDADFEPIYVELILQFDPGYRSAVNGRTRREYRSADRIVYEAIDAAENSLKGKRALRPDAKLFLISNFSMMVARPLMHPRAPRQDASTSDAEIGSMIKADSLRIIDAAAVDRDGLVTAAAVLKSLAENLSALQLKGWRLWDPND